MIISTKIIRAEKKEVSFASSDKKIEEKIRGHFRPIIFVRRSIRNGKDMSCES